MLPWRWSCSTSCCDSGKNGACFWMRLHERTYCTNEERCSRSLCSTVSSCALLHCNGAAVTLALIFRVCGTEKVFLNLHCTASVYQYDR